MEAYNGKNAPAKDKELDQKISDCVLLRYDEMPLAQRAAIDRAAQELHQEIKELKTQSTAKEIVWAVCRKINELSANGGKNG